jgi:hypothetical protein
MEVTIPIPALGPSLGSAFGQMDVDVLALEQARLDPIGRCAGLHEAEGRGDAFIHHLPEFAGSLDLALARRGDTFDGQQFTAD